MYQANGHQAHDQAWARAWRQDRICFHVEHLAADLQQLLDGDFDEDELSAACDESAAVLQRLGDEELAGQVWPSFVAARAAAMVLGLEDPPPPWVAVPAIDGSMMERPGLPGD